MSETVKTNKPELQAASEGLSKFFHMVNRIVPEEQDVAAIPPETLARDALELMDKHGYSQLPVQQGRSMIEISLTNFKVNMHTPHLNRLSSGQDLV